MSYCRSRIAPCYSTIGNAAQPSLGIHLRLAGVVPLSRTCLFSVIRRNSDGPSRLVALCIVRSMLHVINSGGAANCLSHLGILTCRPCPRTFAPRVTSDSWYNCVSMEYRIGRARRPRCRASKRRTYGIPASSNGNCITVRNPSAVRTVSYELCYLRCGLCQLLLHLKLGCRC